jgi:CcmD family protein
MKKAVRRLLVVVAVALTALGSTAALAQQFEKVEGPLREEIPAKPFIAAAYGIIWLMILLYVFFVARGLARVDGEIAELKKKLDRQDARQ